MHSFIQQNKDYKLHDDLNPVLLMWHHHKIDDVTEHKCSIKSFTDKKKKKIQLATISNMITYLMGQLDLHQHNINLNLKTKTKIYTDNYEPVKSMQAPIAQPELSLLWSGFRR